MSEKYCSQCKLHRATGDFTKNRNAKDGLDPWCRGCRRNKNLRYYDPKIARAKKLKQKYGLSMARYDAMFEVQEGRCAICREPPQVGTVLVVDHNHTTGTVRALLCGPCNLTLGNSRESVHILHRCADYLIAHSEAS